MYGKTLVAFVLGGWCLLPGSARAGDGADLAPRHWAFEPVRDPPMPEVREAAWCRSSADRLVLARLEREGVAPSAPAGRRTLLRRAAYDLTGLPPSADEADAFDADPAPDAFERAVDRLLASPRFGERWGRRWLDVARYADTKGYVFEEERRYPYAYTYRDYVVRSFNEDLPYDRFVLEQIAADLLPLGEDKRPLAAMGFLTLGRRFLNNVHDIIDDRIDVVCRGLMALTVGCARCHDHKYDPIPSADYYSVYGVFASTIEPKELPLIGEAWEAEASEGRRAFEEGLAAREAEVEKYLAAKHAEVTAELRRRAPEYMLEAARGKPVDAADKQKLGNLAAGDLHPLAVQRWRECLAEAAQGRHPVLGPWLAFARLEPEAFGERAKDVAAEVAAAASAGQVNPWIAKALAGAPPASLEDVARRYGEAFAAADAAEGASDSAREEVRHVLRSPGAPPAVPLAEAERFFDRKLRNGLRDLRRKVDAWKATAPGAPPRAMALAEAPEPQEPRIFIRGNPSNPGKTVPRQFLAVLSRDRRPFQKGSGRLELAQAIASPENPLTARVIVNRVWMHLLGAPLVPTPGDFGTRAEPPAHPELLDHLAARLVEDRWSLKRLVRRIVLSSAYAQSSDRDPRGEAIDPENRLLWRSNRRRLDLEALRDSLLFASASLDLRAGGPAVEITAQPFSGRRTLYGFIDRQNLQSLYRTFDFASPDASSPQRHVTTVPQQALYLMNSPFAAEQARRLASRPEVAAAPGPTERVQALYRAALGRAAEPDEVALGLRYVEGGDASPSSLSRWERYAQALLLSNELCHID